MDNRYDILQLLRRVADGSATPEEALSQLKRAPFEDLGYAKVDLHRGVRQGAAEVIYGAGKTPEQIAGIAAAMGERGCQNILITRLSPEAAKLVAESGSPTAAAISSHPCAALYGLECINGNIQDSDNNYTRFICVTKDPVIYAGANKISLIIALDNKPGALYEVLSKLAALDIDMTKLESCPVAGSDFEFVFFLELEASVKDPSVRACLEELERSCAQFHFLGGYAEV